MDDARLVAWIANELANTEAAHERHSDHAGFCLGKGLVEMAFESMCKARAEEARVKAMRQVHHMALYLQQGLEP